MAHFAELDANSIVVRVLVVDADDGADGTLRPPKFCTDVLGGRWVRTYYAAAGKRYAGIGDTFDPATGNFTAPPLAPTADDRLAVDAEYRQLATPQQTLIKKFVDRVTGTA